MRRRLRDPAPQRVHGSSPTVARHSVTVTAAARGSRCDRYRLSPRARVPEDFWKFAGSRLGGGHVAAQEADAGSRVTITEIARQAGVSVPTVSRVVNGRSDVSPQTRARVEDLLRRHGYRRRPASSPPGPPCSTWSSTNSAAPGPWRSSAASRRRPTPPVWAPWCRRSTGVPATPASGSAACVRAPRTASSSSPPPCAPSTRS